MQGHPDPTRGTIDAPIDRNPKHDWRFAVMASGKPSVTHYEVIEAFPAASLCDVTLETGRTHQIRVHFAALRHPCLRGLTWCGPRAGAAARVGPGSGCTPRDWASRTPLMTTGWNSPARTRPTCARALDVLAAQT